MALVAMEALDVEAPGVVPLRTKMGRQIFNVVPLIYYVVVPHRIRTWGAPMVVDVLNAICKLV